MYNAVIGIKHYFNAELRPTISIRTSFWRLDLMYFIGEKLVLTHIRKSHICSDAFLYYDSYGNVYA